ncbi:hypothetical protein BATDEDRAFT_21400 [Batrachochytrium dendrobatidis JAM81]|uniref:Uncharacterized protein n=2 Tax=Batrachochytrium dendrobatidis TaxID=109871 RepID=F4NSV6_BATDJ|nr:uncharacterized protein BATDEDRAFT_21400 [Batrachochytrium dendrobatidis JAM81]EGF83860.1 hypothetical protein BATDEDRAFT_21400 [Batrachochytrium dendrobatidis JAM81]|eukprot:XP_006675277.1 hypothetical protein BATDEDRAFT_21400 [Batrachochytrium dendrobatidis JAM81]
MLVTAGYASLAGLMGLGLVLNVARYRSKLMVSLGDGTYEQTLELLQKYTDKGPTVLDDKSLSTPFNSKYFKLTQAVRAHANFIETAPWVFLLVGLAEYNGLDSFYVHTSLSLFLVMRAAHVSDMICTKKAYGPARAFSTLGTMVLILGVSTWNILKVWF